MVTQTLLLKELSKESLYKARQVNTGMSVRNDINTGFFRKVSTFGVYLTEKYRIYLILHSTPIASESTLFALFLEMHGNS